MMEWETEEIEREAQEREALRRQQIQSDYAEVLSTEAGRRVFGGIFHLCGINRADCIESPVLAAYQQGFRAAGLMVANSIREIGHHQIGECEQAYKEFERRFQQDVN